MKNALKILKSTKYFVDSILISKYRDFGLTIDEFVLLIYFTNKSDPIIFNPEVICKDLSLEQKELLSLINSLTTKKIIELKCEKKDKVYLEYIDLTIFYNKLILSLEDNSEVKYTIYDNFEKEFGRVLSPTEYQIISSWLEDKFSEELIREALKEAIFNGVKSLKYIDRILYSWRDKKIENIDDIFAYNKKEAKEEGIVDLFDYEWFKKQD